MIDDPRIRELIRRAGFAEDFRVKPLRGAGSDRLFYRISARGRSAILMTGTGHGAALPRWSKIQRFLRKLGLGVPKIYADDLAIPAIVVEDFGAMPSPKIDEYPAIAHELARLQSIAGGAIERCPTILDNPFDFDAFRQESRYFSDEYLAKYRGISSEPIDRLADEFDRIAKTLSKLPKTFCHRDFQSSNIAVIDGRLRIIDFQSARFGPAEYDLASLLWDSRIEIAEADRASIAEEYFEAATTRGYSANRDEFDRNLHLAALSRTMQSLGAYCFLTFQKQKTAFRALIAPAEKTFFELIHKTGYLSSSIEMLDRR